MSSLESGSNWKMRLRLTSGLLMVKKGFSVVAPTRITTPSSTPGKSTSCWALLKRWISSMKSSVFWPAGREAVVGGGEHLAQLLHAAGHGAELLEMAAALLGQQPCQGGLAGAGRAVEDHRAQPVGRQQPPQQLPLAEKMLLADELGQRCRPHPRRQRLRPRRLLSSLASNSDMGWRSA